MATCTRLRVYPVKSLDGVDVDAARITDAGVLAHDREYALADADGELVTGRREPRLHELSGSVDVDRGRLTLAAPERGERAFDLPGDADAVGAWVTEFLGEPVELRHDASGFVDRAAGPSVVSTATLRTVAEWYDDVTVESLRRRIRVNVEVSGVPAFWEDRFVGADAPDFTVGGVRFEGVEPCVRCAVPTRDPDTGEPTPAFRERFVERRRETFPDWVDRSAFRSDYSLMLIARVPPGDHGRRLRVGDDVRVVD